MHELMQKKRQLIGSLLQISDEDYDSIAEVCHIIRICCDAGYVVLCRAAV